MGVSDDYMGDFAVSFQLKRIVLYPHGDRAPRVIEFRSDSLNIITGDSRTGKSSIIDIVDYCLASSECQVADGVIRSSVAWYAVEFLSKEQALFVARRGPEDGSLASNDVYIGRNLDAIPSASSLEPVTNVPGLAALLTEWAGIPRTADPESRLAPSYSATIRHASRLLFQNQNEISNPSLLFHRQYDDYVKTAIRDTLPFFLGAVSADDLELARQLGLKRRELRRLQQQVKELEELADAQGSRASTLVLEGIDLGVIDQSEQSQTGRAQAIETLRTIEFQQVLDRDVDALNPVDRTLQRKRLLRRRLAALRDEYQTVQEQSSVATDFFDVRSSFDGVAGDQIERLRLGAELPETTSPLAGCPVCNSPLDERLPTQADIVASLTSLRNTVDAFSQDPPQLRALAEDLSGRAGELRREMVLAQGQLESIERQERRTREAAEQRDLRMLWYGRASLFLESVDDEARLGEMRRHMSRLQMEIQELGEQIGVRAVRERMASIVSRISQEMTKTSAPLELEWSSFPVRFDPRELTVVVDGPTGPIPLSRIGSGEAWVAYHMVTHLALHQHYARERRPVPHMLFLDQPSQVYFPRESDAITVAAERVGDMAAAERLLRVAHAATVAGAGFQVIMTEHAEIDEPWFHDSVIENWRDGRALIPPEWV